MASPIDLFFKMGDKATRGDPRRQQDFTYYMLWILFLAFALMFVSNLWRLLTVGGAMNAVWTMVGFAVMGLQFFSLKGMYDLRKMRDRPVERIERIESPDEMLKSFKSNGGKTNVRKEKA